MTENIRPFSPSLRSSTRIKQSEKRRFCDPSIAAAKHLLGIQRRIAETGGQPPQSLAIIVGLSSAAYKRSDGVYVLPITALKP